MGFNTKINITSGVYHVILHMSYVCILYIHACMYNICTLYIYHSSLSALISSSNHFQSTHQTPNSVDPDRHVPKLFQQDQGCRPIIGVPTCRSQSDVVTFVTRPKGGRRKRETRGLHPGWTPYEFHGIFLVVIFLGGILIMVYCNVAV